MMTFKLIEKDGKKVLEMVCVGMHTTDVEYATVYGLKDAPYIRRMSEKIYLTPEMIAGKTVVYQ